MQSSDELYLDTLLGQVETNNLEFKAALSSFDRDKAIGYCAAIANEGGGHLILGVSDHIPHQIEGTNAFRNPAGMELLVFSKLAIKISIRELDYMGKRVVDFVIPGRQVATPIGFDGRFLMRAGESLVPMSAHAIAEILAESKGPATSHLVTDYLPSHEIRELLDVDHYFSLISDTKPADLHGQLTILQRRGLLAGDGAAFAVTLLGALFVARNLASFAQLEMRRIRFIKYAGTDRVNAVFEHFETRGYGLAFEDLLALIASHTPVREVIEGGLRQTIPMFPPTAVREFLANALIHQDLNENSVQLTVEIFTDRLEIRNPGEPLIDAKRFVDETRARNPELAELMRVARICEVRGSGIDRAVQQIEDYTQPAPTFKKETAATTVTMFDHMEFSDMTVDERIWSAFLHCCIRYESSDRLSNTSLRERFGLSAEKTTLVSQTIAAAVEAGVIKLDPRVGSSRRLAKYVPFFA